MGVSQVSGDSLWFGQVPESVVRLVQAWWEPFAIADIELAKRIASKRGTGYQTVLKEAIRYRLKRTG
jgi:hypothetical protein